MNPLLKCLLLALAVTATPLAAAHAAQFEVLYKSCPEDFGKDQELAKVAPKTNCKGSADRLINGVMVLRLVGDIAPGDADHLQDFLETQIRAVSGYGYDGDGTMVTVEMSGQGGSLAGALELGSFFEDKDVQTRIVTGTTCAGPCALAFMGGAAKWTRFSREALDRRLEAGGQLIFRSPLYPSGDADPEKLREIMRRVQSYATHAEIPPLVLGKILALKQDKSFAIDNVFWAKVANITIDGVKPKTDANDNDYISACLSQIDWTYGLGFDGSDDEPPQLYDKDRGWDEGEISARTSTYVLVPVVFSFDGDDYWCVLNRSRTAEVKIPRKDVRKVLAAYKGRNSLLAHDTNDDIDLHGNEIYFSKAPNDLHPARAENSLDLLLRDPQTKLADIADPDFKWNPWRPWDPWFVLEEP
jgi:hypothetical protein